MKHFFTISLCFLALSLSAQETITYPYNPDGDADGLVAVPDLQDILAVYGNPFSPAEIMVGDTALSEWIQILSQALQDQQAVIDAMQGAGGCDFFYPFGRNGEPILSSITGGDTPITYTVPDGKALYLLHCNGFNPFINDLFYFDQFSNKAFPIFLNSGDVLSTNVTVEPTIFNGLIVDNNQDVQIVTFNLTSDESNETIPQEYIVPIGKILYLVYSENLMINGNIASNDTDSPFILSSGNVLSTNGWITNFNGYLVDEDYFADCGGGGSSEGAGGAGGGCNFQFPEGLDGEAITIEINGTGSYVIPEGKRLYLTQVHGPQVMIDDMIIGQPTIGPFIISASQEISSTSENNDLNLNGILVNSNDNLDAITLQVGFSSSSSEYTVPDGKRLYITATHDGNMTIDGLEFNSPPHNVTLVSSGQTIGVVNPEQTIVTINGYLVDEDYFADCGGGGSSEEVDEEELGPCQGEFTVNYHGYDYELVEIGEQCWFAENCRHLPSVSPPWLGYEDDQNSHAYVLDYEGSNLNEAKNRFFYNAFGALYNQQAVIDWPLCPSGWRVTSSLDWNSLNAYVGTNANSMSLYTNSDNWSGLSIVLCGSRDGGGFGDLPTDAWFWLSDWETGFPDNYPAIHFSNNEFFQEVSKFESSGLSVRCIKD